VTRDLFVDALSDRNGCELLPDEKTGRIRRRCTLCSAPRNEQGERTFEFRSLGEFDATILLLAHKGLQPVRGQRLPQSQLFSPKHHRRIPR
jgi:hypothetical protein